MEFLRQKPRHLSCETPSAMEKDEWQLYSKAIGQLFKRSLTLAMVSEITGPPDLFLNGFI